MNILLYWKTDIKHLEAIRHLFGEGKIFYLCDSEAEKSELEIEWIQKIPLEKSIDSLLQYHKSSIVLDERNLKKLQPYETTAIEIVNRWRRSITTGKYFSDIKNALYKYYKYWIDTIIRNDIKLFVLFTEPHIPMTYIPYAVCKAFNIPTIILGLLPVIDGRKLNYYLESALESLDGRFEERYRRLQEEYEKSNKTIEISENLQYYFSMYGKENKKVERVTTYNEKDSLLSKVKFYTNRAKVYTDQGRYAVLFNKAKYYIKANTDAKPLLRFLESIEEEPRNEKYFVFFLHLQPESTTLPKGGVFTDQLLVIDMISKCLPEGVFLYVKEHPAYWELSERRESIYESRNKEFYTHIKRLANVRIINHNYSSLELMDKCVGAINITGTAGFEAMFKCIPNIVFGYASYAKYKYSYNVRNTDECQRAIDEILTSPKIGSLRDVKIYLKAIEPDVISYGCDEKSYQDNGVPAPSSEDFDEFIRKLKWFFDNTYNKAELEEK